MINQNKADLHSPRELLDSAYSLIATSNPEFMRSAILESLSALETYVQDIIFPLLEERMDPLFVKWLKEKTKMDFDGRLEQLPPLALDIRIDRGTDLWREYKEAKRIRNEIAHHGRIATKEEATKVIQTVEKWLSYLSSSAGVDFSLIKLKEFLERYISELSTHLSEVEIVNVIKSFYSDSLKSASFINELEIKGHRADLILSFGGYKTIFEIKMSKRHIDESLLQLERLYSKLNEPSGYRLALIILTDRGIPKTYSDITRVNKNTSVIFINIKKREI